MNEQVYYIQENKDGPCNFSVFDSVDYSMQWIAGFNEREHVVRFIRDILKGKSTWVDE